MILISFPGQIYFMMVLETCNISLTMDVRDAEDSFKALKLSDYAGENISALATDALKLIKVMNGSYAMNVHTGSDLLKKVSSTSSDYFNRTVFGHLDQAHRMEDKYMLKDPGLLKRTHYIPHMDLLQSVVFFRKNMVICTKIRIGQHLPLHLKVIMSLLSHHPEKLKIKRNAVMNADLRTTFEILALY